MNALLRYICGVFVWCAAIFIACAVQSQVVAQPRNPVAMKAPAKGEELKGSVWTLQIYLQGGGDPQQFAFTVVKDDGKGALEGKWGLGNVQGTWEATYKDGLLKGEIVRTRPAPAKGQNPQTFEFEVAVCRDANGKPAGSVAHGRWWPKGEKPKEGWYLSLANTNMPGQRGQTPPQKAFADFVGKVPAWKLTLPDGTVVDLAGLKPAGVDNLTGAAMIKGGTVTFPGQAAILADGYLTHTRLFLNWKEPGGQSRSLNVNLYEVDKKWLGLGRYGDDRTGTQGVVLEPVMPAVVGGGN
jgi:hypothetical protein